MIKPTQNKSNPSANDPMLQPDFQKRVEELMKIHLPRFYWPREEALPKKALEHLKKVAASRKLSIKFLKDAGMIERPGKLAWPYR